MNLLPGLLTLLVTASLIGQLLLWRRLRAERLQYAERDREHRQQIQRLVDEFAALCRASAGAGDHVVKLEQQLRRVVDRQDQWELRASDRSYQQAIQMVHKGAGAVELVNNCGLTRGEADLIVMLHGMAKAG
jgi:hypothetical protein